MIIAAALAGVIVLMAATLTWAARLVHIGDLDMQALADKLATPAPESALDWPELRVSAVIPEPGNDPFVLLRVAWPAHPQQTAELEFRRRQTLQRVHAILVAEQPMVAPYG